MAWAAQEQSGAKVLVAQPDPGAWPAPGLCDAHKPASAEGEGEWSRGCKAPRAPPAQLHQPRAVSACRSDQRRKGSRTGSWARVSQGRVHSPARKLVALEVTGGGFQAGRSTPPPRSCGAREVQTGRHLLAARGHAVCTWKLSTNPLLPPCPGFCVSSSSVGRQRPCPLWRDVLWIHHRQQRIGEPWPFRGTLEARLSAPR